MAAGVPDDREPDPAIRCWCRCSWTSDIPTYNIDGALLEAAVGRRRTRDHDRSHARAIRSTWRSSSRSPSKHGLWLVEDCCDALGSTYEGRQVGTFGDVGTLSFYPAHHITMGEGGAVFTNDRRAEAHRSSRFATGGATATAHRGTTTPAASASAGNLATCRPGTTTSTPTPTSGYNLKITDMQAASGWRRLDRLEGFIASRKAQFLVPQGSTQDLRRANYPSGSDRKL